VGGVHLRLGLLRLLVGLEERPLVLVELREALAQLFVVDLGGVERVSVGVRRRSPLLWELPAGPSSLLSLLP